MSATTAVVKTVKFVHGDMGQPSEEMELTVLQIRRLEGVGDLAMAVGGRFATALYMEAEAGKTTPEAYAKLEEAVAAEAAA